MAQWGDWQKLGAPIGATSSDIAFRSLADVDGDRLETVFTDGARLWVHVCHPFQAAFDRENPDVSGGRPQLFASVRRILASADATVTGVLRTDASLRFTLSITVTGCRLRWAVCATAGSAEQLSTHLAAPLMRFSAAMLRRERALVAVIRHKDEQLADAPLGDRAPGGRFNYERWCEQQSLAAGGSSVDALLSAPFARVAKSNTVEDGDDHGDPPAEQQRAEQPAAATDESSKRAPASSPGESPDAAKRDAALLLAEKPSKRPKKRIRL